MTVQKMKKVRMLLAYMALLVGMVYSALALTTGPANAAGCDCEVLTQEVVDNLCQFECYPATTGYLAVCNSEGWRISCDTGCQIIVNVCQ
jgi:hypothetical protein